MIPASLAERESADRIPPNNLEAEMALLGSVLVDKDMMAAVSEVVRPDDFYASLHESIYRALYTLHESGKPLDKVALAEELRSRGMLDDVGGLAYLTSLMDTVPTAASAVYYARLIREKASLRQLIHAGTQITSIGYDSEYDVDSAILAAETALAGIRDPHSAASGRCILAECAADITPREQQFLFPPYMPIGEVTWVEGVTKSGKTLAVIDILARITRGSAFMSTQLPRANVAILTCEDSSQSTIIPRLIAANADRERVFLLRAQQDGRESMVTFARDLAAIEQQLRQHAVAALLVDGTFGFFGTTDTNDYGKSFTAMVPLVEMTRRLNMATIAVRHVRKSDGPALSKGIGSVGYASLGRSTISVGVDRNDESGASRIWSHAGSNVGETGPSISFTVEGVAIEGFTRTVGRVRWGDVVDVTADEAMASKQSEDRADKGVADEFIHAALAGGPRPASEIFALADQQHVPRRSVQRAADRAGIIKTRRGFGEGAIWSPPSYTPAGKAVSEEEL